MSNKALLIGINDYSISPLNGCVNDINDLMKCLIRHYNFKEQTDFVILKDKEATKINIINELYNLVSNIKEGDNIIFHYSGHGSQIPTKNNIDEIDGLDEIICPYDFNWTADTMITDKEFKSIFSIYPKKCNFIWISDSCHSQDLSKNIHKYIKYRSYPIPEYMRYFIEQGKKKQLYKTLHNKELSKDNINNLNGILLSGCRSNQTSADAYFCNRYNGAFTFYLLKELNAERGRNISLNALIYNVNKRLELNNFNQQPQIEGNINLMNKPFLK